MPTTKFAVWFIAQGELLINDLLQGYYQPQAVRQVEIPKPKGGFRKPGIPTVTDRIIQQAIAQMLSPVYEQEFSERSYGFRPNRSAQKALQQASEYVAEGRKVVVDMDMKSFFDAVNHDRLMYELSTKIGDKILLRLIRKYLRSGILSGGLISQRTKGTPQGSPLSPLLSNIVLDELDKEPEKRGHCYVRYADDFSIYVRSQKAGVSFEQIISELNPKLRGWFEYFKHTKSKGLFRESDAWIRRKLRCFRIKQTKRVIGLVRFLKKQGVVTYQSWIIALSGVGWWRKSSAPQIHQAMGNSWFDEQNLFNLSLYYEKLNY